MSDFLDRLAPGGEFSLSYFQRLHQHKPEDRKDEHAEEHRRRVEALTRIRNEPAEPRLGGEEFADNNPSQRAADAEAQAYDDIGQGGRHQDLGEDLVLRTVECGAHFEQVRIYGADADEGVEQDRKDRDRKDYRHL